MKLLFSRFLPPLLAALLLAGCAVSLREAELPAPAETPVPTAAPAPTEAPMPTETPIPTPTPADDEFVRVADYIPGIRTDLKYAAEDNFTGAVIYDFTEAYLRYGTVKKLAAAQDMLEEQGLGLKIWDAFRPVSAQFRLWEICPDARYVANPNTGYSSHSRGNTVDLTLVDSGGAELTMPTGFDDFSPKADRDYSDCTPEEAENARLLEAVMTDRGFRPYAGEWWHFSDEDAYDVETEFSPPPSE